MKKILITIAVTAVTTYLFCSMTHGVRTGIERLWLMSAVKAPGRMALDEIHQDFIQGQDDVAKAKFEIFRAEWARFNSETNFHGQALGNIMVEFSGLNRTNSISKP